MRAASGMDASHLFAQSVLSAVSLLEGGDGVRSVWSLHSTCSGTCSSLRHRLCRGQGLLPSGGGGGSEGLVPSGSIVLSVCPAPKELIEEAGGACGHSSPVCTCVGIGGSALRQPGVTQLSLLCLSQIQCKAGVWGRLGLRTAASWLQELRYLGCPLRSGLPLGSLLPGPVPEVSCGVEPVETCLL